MAGNTSTKKTFRGVADKAPADRTLPSKGASADTNMRGENAGQITGDGPAKFANPMNGISAKIGGIDGLHDDIGEKSGFITDGYLDKQDTPYGEAAKFNFLPPGMDISNQENAEIHDMPMRKLTAESYPGDGWMPAPRDMPE
jgi:hypothetical protein